MTVVETKTLKVTLSDEDEEEVRGNINLREKMGRGWRKIRNLLTANKQEREEEKKASKKKKKRKKKKKAKVEQLDIQVEGVKFSAIIRQDDDDLEAGEFEPPPGLSPRSRAEFARMALKKAAKRRKRGKKLKDKAGKTKKKRKRRKKKKRKKKKYL